MPPPGNCESSRFQGTRRPTLIKGNSQILLASIWRDSNRTRGCSTGPEVAAGHRSNQVTRAGNSNVAAITVMLSCPPESSARCRSRWHTSPEGSPAPSVAAIVSSSTPSVSPSLQRSSRSPSSRRRRSTSTSTCLADPPSALSSTWRKPERVTSRAAVARRQPAFARTCDPWSGVQDDLPGTRYARESPTCTIRRSRPQLRAAVSVDPMPRSAAS